MRNNPNNIKTKLKALSIYQIVGGIIGIAATVHFITTIHSINEVLILIILLAFSLFGYSVYCGIVLLRTPLIGLKLSKINQLLQVIHFSLFGYAFKYIAGIHFSPGLNLTHSINLELDVSLSTWQININTSEPYMIIHLNVVALFLIAFIDKALRILKSTELDKKIMSIGQEKEVKQLS